MNKDYSGWKYPEEGRNVDCQESVMVYAGIVLEVGEAYGYLIDDTDTADNAALDIVKELKLNGMFWNEPNAAWAVTRMLLTVEGWINSECDVIADDRHDPNVAINAVCRMQDYLRIQAACGHLLALICNTNVRKEP